MKTDRFRTLAGIALALLLVSSSAIMAATVVYEENFDVDPEWSVTWSPEPTEFAHHTGCCYEIRIMNDDDIVKYAYSGQFPTVGNTNYAFAFDFRFTEIGWGQPIRVHLTDSPHLTAETAPIALHWDDSHANSNYLRLIDPMGNWNTGPRPSLHTWYRIEFVHDVEGAGTASWTITNLVDQTVFWAENSVPFAQPLFDTIAIGVHVWNGENDDHSGIRIDNILIENEVTVIQPLTFESDRWEGVTYCQNVYQGPWLPEMDGTCATLASGSLCWNHMRTRYTVGRGHGTGTLHVLPWLSSGGSYPDRATIGFGDGYAHYQGQYFVGVVFVYGEIRLISNIAHDPYDVIGSYTPGEQMEIELFIDEDGWLTVSGTDIAASLDTNGLLPDDFRIILAVDASTDGFQVCTQPFDEGSLLAYYMFDDLTANDYVGGYHGTLVGNTAFHDMDTPHCGHVLDLRGGAGAVDIGDHEAFRFANSSMSVSCWVQITDNADVGRFFVSLGRNPAAAPGNSGIGLGKGRSGSGDGRIQFHVDRHGHNVSMIQSDLTGDELPKDTWMHLVGVIDKGADEVRLYIDGIRQTYETVEYPPSPVVTYDLYGGDPGTPFEVTVGRWLANSEYHNSFMDDVRIYDRALSEADVLAIHAEEYERHHCHIPDGCIVYEENFDTDPGWATTWTPGPTESSHWTGDAYEVRIKDAHDIVKYAYSGPFLPVGHENYSFAFDFLFTEISWGQPIQVRLTDSPHLDAETAPIALHWDDSWPESNYLRLIDPAGNWNTGPRPSLHTWYRIEFAHDVEGSGNASWTITNLDDQSVFWAAQDQPFVQPLFDTIAIGVWVWHGEGDHSGIRIDNILVTSGCEQEEGGLLAHYPFDGTADDTSGNERHGIVTGAILTNGRDGSVDGAYRFNGLDTRIDLGFGPGHTYSALTANLWVRSLAEGNGFGGHDENAFGGVWEHGNFIAVYDLVDPQTANSFRVGGSGPYNQYVGRVRSEVTGIYEIAPDRIDDAQWHMLTLVWDGEDATLYINGHPEHTYAAPGTIVPDLNWFVGARDTAGSGWPGAPFSEHAECDIDDVSIWNLALTPQEVAELYDPSIVLTEAPRILSITDVPEDQGGRVYVNFARSIFDDDLLNTKAAELYTVERLDGDRWVAVASGAAYGSATYTYEVPTLVDSTAADPGLTTFRVIAAMDEGNWASDTATGYSVDNIPPGIPENLAWKSPAWGVLQWDPVPDNDLHYYTIYGAPSDSFDDAMFVASTVSSEHEVDPWSHEFWFVTATDRSGLTGDPSIALEGPDSGSVPGDALTMVSLGAFPSPFAFRTSISYTVPQVGPVSLSIYDLAGRQVRTLVNGTVAQGRHEIIWDGCDDRGRALAAGVYFSRLTVSREVRTMRISLVR